MISQIEIKYCFSMCSFSYRFNAHRGTLRNFRFHSRICLGNTGNSQDSNIQFCIWPFSHGNSSSCKWSRFPELYRIVRWNGEQKQMKHRKWQNQKYFDKTNKNLSFIIFRDRRTDFVYQMFVGSALAAS